MLKSFANRMGLLTRDQSEDIINNAVELAVKAAKQEYPQWYLDYANAHQYNMPEPETYERQAELLTRVVYLYTAVMLTAQSAASQDFDVYDLKNAEIKNHVLELLLKSPNPNQTGFEFLRDHFVYKLTNGGSYWWVNATNPTAEPSELWLIPPGNIEPKPDGNLGIAEYWYYPGDGSIIPLPTWQVIWFRGFHPSNQFASMSAVTPLAQTMYTDLETQKFLRTVYGPNSGRLPGIIAFKSPVGDVDWKKIKQDVINSSNEKSYLMLRGVGDGVTWLQAAATLNEMQVYQGRQMTKTDIFNAIAPGLINMTSESATEANSKTGKETFAEFTLYPLLVDTAQKINKELSPRFGGVRLEFDDPRNIASQNAAADAAIKTQKAGLYSTYVSTMPKSLAAELAGIELPRGVEYSALDAQPQAPQLPVPQQTSEISPDENALAAELIAWQKYSTKHLGTKARAFETKSIPPALYLRVSRKLAGAKSANDINEIFASAADEIPTIVLAMAINRAAANG